MTDLTTCREPLSTNMIGCGLTGGDCSGLYMADNAVSGIICSVDGVICVDLGDINSVG
jgi:hypothetical protein